jgi:hypothetical protein
MSDSLNLSITLQASGGLPGRPVSPSLYRVLYCIAMPNLGLAQGIGQYRQDLHDIADQPYMGHTLQCMSQLPGGTFSMQCRIMFGLQHSRDDSSEAVHLTTYITTSRSKYAHSIVVHFRPLSDSLEL